VGRPDGLPDKFLKFRQCRPDFFRTKIENFEKRPDGNSGQILQNKGDASFFSGQILRTPSKYDFDDEVVFFTAILSVQQLQ
jgi:hypothetical protein